MRLNEDLPSPSSSPQRAQTAEIKCAERCYVTQADTEKENAATLPCCPSHQLIRAAHIPHRASDPPGYSHYFSP